MRLNTWTKNRDVDGKKKSLVGTVKYITLQVSRLVVFAVGNGGGDVIGRQLMAQGARMGEELGEKVQQQILMLATFSKYYSFWNLLFLSPYLNSPFLCLQYLVLNYPLQVGHPSRLFYHKEMKAWHFLKVSSSSHLSFRIFSKQKKTRTLKTHTHLKFIRLHEFWSSFSRIQLVLNS